jgi:Tol biopolymer transport system component
VCLNGIYDEFLPLYVTDLATHATRDLGAYSGQLSDDEMAWSPDGERLAVQSKSTVEVFDVTRHSSDPGSSMKVAARCRLASPAFLTQDQIAAIRTCYSSTGIVRTSSALVFNVVTGKAAALIAAAPPWSTFQGLSVDSSGQHILLGLVNSGSAEDVQVQDGRLVTVSREAPTDAQW